MTDQQIAVKLLKDSKTVDELKEVLEALVKSQKLTITLSDIALECAWELGNNQV